MAEMAITRLPGEGLGDCALTFVERRAIDAGLAARQHAGYRAALRELGVQVEALEPLIGMPDGVFVEDCVVVLDEVAVVARLGVESRRGEVATLAAAVGRHRELRWMQAGTLEGGDVLRIGRRLFVGVSARTSRAGVEEFRRLVEPLGYAVMAVEVRGCLHLKTGVTALDGETVLVNAAWVDGSAFGGLHKIEAAEPFGANCLPVGEVVLSASYPRTCEKVGKAGFRVRVVEISEFEKMEAGVTCLSVVLRV